MKLREARFGPDVALKLAGAGGDGAQTAAMLLTRAAINEGFDATHIPSYGPESRGGTSFADVHLAETEVLSPAAPRPHVLVAFNAASLLRFGPKVARGGVILYDSAMVVQPPTAAEGVKAVGVPFSRIAQELGTPVVKNIVALGALLCAVPLLEADTLRAALRRALRDKPALLPQNEAALEAGAAALRGAAR